MEQEVMSHLAAKVRRLMSKTVEQEIPTLDEGDQICYPCVGDVLPFKVHCQFWESETFYLILIIALCNTVTCYPCFVLHVHLLSLLYATSGSVILALSYT